MKMVVDFMDKGGNMLTDVHVINDETSGCEATDVQILIEQGVYISIPEDSMEKLIREFRDKQQLARQRARR